MERHRKRDEILGEVVGGGVEAGVDAGFTALAEAAPIPVAVIGAVVLGVSLLGLLAWKSLSLLTERKNAG